MISVENEIPKLLLATFPYCRLMFEIVDMGNQKQVCFPVWRVASKGQYCLAVQRWRGLMKTSLEFDLKDVADLEERFNT